MSRLQTCSYSTWMSTWPVMSAAKTVRGEPAAPNGRCASLPSSRREKTAPQFSSWKMSPGASAVKISIESWSPR